MDKDLERIVQQLKESEEKGQALDIPSPLRNDLFGQVGRYTNHFLDTLGDRKAYEAEGYDSTDADQGFEVGEAGSDMGAMLDFIGARVDTTGLNPTSGGHLGYIPGGGIPASALGDYLAAISNRYAGNFYASPGAVRMENAMIRWTGRLVGYPDGFGGNLTSGGSIANLTAIATARSAKGIKGKDLEKTVIYLSAQAHHSLPKALRLTGLGECIIRYIPLDSAFRMDPVALREQVDRDQRAGQIGRAHV